jgi:preprotein translocase subunit SecG
MLYGLLITVHVIASLVLIIVILLQAGRGGGLSETFGMSSTQTIFGTSATRFLQNATSVCAVVFLLTCLSLAAMSTQRSRSLMETQRMKKMVTETAPAPAKQEPVKQEAPKSEPKQPRT